MAGVVSVQGQGMVGVGGDRSGCVALEGMALES